MRDRTADRTLLGVAIAFGVLAMLTYTVEPYELFHDELYYWAGARRPMLGYVDHPPLAPWILAISVRVFGDGPLGFAVVPGLCAVATVWLSGRIARTLGAGPFGQVLAGLAVAVVPVYMVFFSFYSVNAIELLLWTAATLVLAELMRTGNERLWLAFGAIAGIGLLDKHTFALFALALAVGMTATPLRAQVRSPWLWGGFLLAVLLASPNLYWNAVNGWPSLAFYSTRGEGILDASPLEFVELQLAVMNPVNLLVWVPGLVFLLGARAARPYRALGIAYLVLVAVIFLAGQRRVDRMAGAYPIALAAGAVVWDRWTPRRRGVIRGALCGLLVLFGGLSALGTVPILSPRGIADFYEAIGEKPEIEIGDLGSNVPLWLLGRLEWERFAEQVFEACESLPAGDRERAALLGPHWVFASVLDYYGRDRETLPVVAPHNAYYFWRGEAAGRDVVVSVGVAEEALSEHFERTRLLDTFRCEHCAVFRPDLPIRVSYGPERPLEQLLDEWRHFGILPSPALGGGEGAAWLEQEADRAGAEASESDP